jgi:hypothetical protein
MSCFRFQIVAFVFALVFSGELVVAQAPVAPKPVPPPAPPVILGPFGIKRIPQPGVTIAEADRAELTAGVTALGKEIEVLRASLSGKSDALALLPDVEIFHKAVDWALRYDEFFDAKQVVQAKQQLALGMSRSQELQAGKPSWLSATGLVPRGYRSKIDGSVQPYGMLIPSDWKPEEKTPRRLDFWCHGRGEKLSELDFVNQRLTSKGEFEPSGAFTLHLYGRFCCANKFAGEVDLFEALEHAKRSYNIDPNQLVIRGFSMGGASAWQFGAHFPGMWATVQPGAGFADTKEFMKLGSTPEKPLPPVWEQTLWRWYDATVYAANLGNTTTVAYSGELDGQKQAADIMLRFAEPEGVKIQHIIGPQTPHKIKPETKPEIEAAVASGIANHAAVPQKLRFVTYTLIYPEMDWLRLEGLEKHWERAEVNAEVQGATIVASTKNITALRFLSKPAPGIASVVLDGQTLPIDWPKDGASYQRKGGKWKAAAAEVALAKKPGLCGPIDHAFMDSFVFVHPTGTPFHPATGAWAKAELDHATEFWRRVYRGEAPVKDDVAITDADIAKSNLVLWGDPSSNAVLRRVLAKLPVKWTKDSISLGDGKWAASETMPLLIFPNPLNPERYIVLNSGVTFREQALLNNADQTAKLPDWAVISLTTPPNGKWAGEVKAAGFFNEQWQVVAP